MADAFTREERAALKAKVYSARYALDRPFNRFMRLADVNNTEALRVATRELLGLVEEYAQQLDEPIMRLDPPDDPDPGDMDGDHESGLASAGFGTDEDYGG